MMSGKTNEDDRDGRPHCFPKRLRLLLRVLYKLAELGVKSVGLFKKFLA